MPPSSIAPQDPSMSPTYSMSTNQSQQMITGSIRRNLFAGHLSRRPPVPTSEHPFATPIAPSEEQTQSNVLSLAPTTQPSRRSLAFNDLYDLNGSPPPTQAASQAANVATRDNIIALHPVTGRPLLPAIPTLPPRLPYLDGDEEEEEMSDVEHEQQHAGHQAGFTRSPSFHTGLNHMAKDFELEQDAVDLDSSELERLTTYHNSSSSSMRLNVNQFLDMTSEESRADGERIEYLLLEMASRQRARARAIPPPDNTMTTQDVGLNTTRANPSGNSQPTSTPSVISGSSRRRAGIAGAPSTTAGRQTATKPSRKDASPQRAESHIHGNQHPISLGKDPSMLPVGKAIDPLEKDELVGLIMTSLRRKVAQADEEGWMYGVRDGMGIGMGALGIDGEPLD